jgi:hypothetical protein
MMNSSKRDGLELAGRRSAQSTSNGSRGGDSSSHDRPAQIATVLVRLGSKAEATD